ncbi:MAG TPA: hypothetical protein HA302_07530 [Thermococcaceae archaeon]|nr:hypothetical protein [Thermococcaceae archaeon]
MAGGTESFGVGYEDFWVLKLDKGGNVKWQKIYGGSGSEWAISVATADNGDSIVAGFTNSFGAGYDDAWVLRLDANGNVKWQKTYGGNDDDLIRAVTTAPNGDIIATGYTYSFGAGYSDFWVLRLDENGNVKWQMTYGGNDEDYPVAIAVAPNGEIIVTGATLSFGAGGTDVWVLRLDANGNVKWQKTYGGSADEEAYAVAVAENGDIIVAGDTMSFGAGGADFWVLRLDANGNIKWQKAYGGSGDEDAWAIAIVENGDIIVTGESNSFGAGYYDAWLLRLDANGNVKWQKTYGGIDNDDIARAVLIAENSDLIVAGATYSFSVSEADGWVLRLPPDGNLQNCEFCRDSNAQVSETSAEVSTSAAVVGQSNAVVKDTIAEIYDTNANVKTLLAYAPPKDTTTSSRTTTSSTITSSTSTSQGYGTTTTETTEEGDGFEVSVTCGPAAFLVLILIGGAVARIRGRRDD